jgi:serine/threonine-protein kinase
MQRSTRVRGTPAYMAPEQITGAPLGPHTDLYSLGMTIYEAVCGRTPFVEGEMIYHQVHSVPQPPSAHAPGLPPELDELVMSCLAKDPSARPKSAQSLAASLRALAEKVASTAAPTGTRLSEAATETGRPAGRATEIPIVVEAEEPAGVSAESAASAAPGVSAASGVPAVSEAPAASADSASSARAAGHRWYRVALLVGLCLLVAAGVVAIGRRQGRLISSPSIAEPGSSPPIRKTSPSAVKAPEHDQPAPVLSGKVPDPSSQESAAVPGRRSKFISASRHARSSDRARSQQERPAPDSVLSPAADDGDNRPSESPPPLNESAKESAPIAGTAPSPAPEPASANTPAARPVAPQTAQSPSRPPAAAAKPRPSPPPAKPASPRPAEVPVLSF